MARDNEKLTYDEHIFELRGVSVKKQDAGKVPVAWREPANLQEMFEFFTWVCTAGIHGMTPSKVVREWMAGTAIMLQGVVRGMADPNKVTEADVKAEIDAMDQDEFVQYHKRHDALWAEATRRAELKKAGGVKLDPERIWTEVIYL